MSDRVCLGLDYGGRRVGIALGYQDLSLARPLKTIVYSSDEELLERIALEVKEWNPTRFVVGLPQYEDHKPHPIAKKIIKFCELLESRFGLEVVRVDESFTSVEAERLIVKKNISREKKKELLDMLSAQLILQDFFSSNVATGA